MPSRDRETRGSTCRPQKLRVGRRLRGLRTARSWSQEELASRAALSVTTVRRYERGNVPRLEPLLKLAEVLETSLDELALDADHPNPCRRAVLERLPACSALPPHLGPLLVLMMDLILSLHRGVEEVAAWGRLEKL